MIEICSNQWTKARIIPCYNIVIMEEKKKVSRGSEFWQIIFPALIGLALIGFLCVWVVIGVNPGELTRFAEISTVLLVIPVITLSLFSFIILGFLIYLVQRLIVGLPPVTIKILEFLDKVKGVVKKVSETIVQPVISPAAIATGIRNLFSKNGNRYRIE